LALLAECVRFALSALEKQNGTICDRAVPFFESSLAVSAAIY
jgi:hypothetical protein